MEIIRIDEMIVVRGVVTLEGKFERNRGIEKREVLFMYDIWEPLETEVYTTEFFNNIKSTIDSHDNYYLISIEFYSIIDGTTVYHSYTF